MRAALDLVTAVSRARRGARCRDLEGTGGRAHRRGGRDARRHGSGHGRRRPRQHGRRACSRPPSRARCSSARPRSARREQTVVYEDAGVARAEGQGGRDARCGARCASSPGRAGSLKSQGLEAPFVGRDRELRQIKELFHTTRRREARAARLGHRHRRHRQVAPLVGVLQVLRRDRAGRLLAPRPLPRLRRRRRLLGARRHGADALRDRRGRRAEPWRSRSCAPRSRSTCSTPRSVRSSSLGSRSCSGSASTSNASGKISSPPGGSSSSGSRRSYPTVLAFEDMQWADSSSARLRRVPARVVEGLGRSS